MWQGAGMAGSRRPLRWVGVWIPAVALAGAAALGGLAGCSNPASSPVTEAPVTRALAIPPLAEGTVSQGRRTYALDIQEGTTDFGVGGPTDTYGVNQSYLGPTLRMTTGEDVRMDVHNGLGTVTTLHWHGMHVPAEMDGGPHQLIDPGQTWSPQWQVRQPAATLWYHAHPHGQTSDQVYRGVAGMILVDDPVGGPQLPHEYGVDDIPVIVQDKSFDADGQLEFDQRGPSSTGFLGDTVMVNGTIGAYLDVPTTHVRLRLLNASTARIYKLGFADDRTFDVVGTDGGLLTAPVGLDRIQLSPGERAEIVVAMAPGETAELRNYSPDFGGRVAGNSRFGTGDYRVLELRAAPTLRESPAAPATLAQFSRMPESSAEDTRTFTINAQIINRRPVDMGRIDEVVPLDATEVWVLRNRDPQPHNFHVHTVQFQVLDIDGAPPPPHLAGWKDTVYLAPGSEVRIIASFTDYADPTWPYMYHCHLLWHEDSGLMGQFVVVAPGQTPVPPPDPYPQH
jgi:FtsP/CotA-like multicopper oxidase with cupredoxin domain